MSGYRMVEVSACLVGILGVSSELLRMGADQIPCSGSA